MGISITTPEAGDFPRPVTVTLECDDGRMMFCRGFIQYTHRAGGMTRKIATVIGILLIPAMAAFMWVLGAADRWGQRRCRK